MPYIGKHSVYATPVIGGINIRLNTADDTAYVLESGEFMIYISREELAELIFAPRFSD